MSKYVLDPSGKIIKENKPVDAGSVTQEMLKKQVNHFTPDEPKKINLPTDFRDDKSISSSIVKSEQPIFENNSIFPKNQIHKI